MEEQKNDKSAVAERRRHTTFGLAVKDPPLLIACLLILAGAVLRIVYYACGGSLGACLGGWKIPLMAILPVFAAAVFIAEALVHGRDMLFKTSFPVLLGAVFFIFRSICIYTEGGSFINRGIVLAACIVYCASAFLIWELTVNGARIRSKLPVIAASLIALAAVVVFELVPVIRAGANQTACLHVYAEILTLAGMLASSIGLKAITWENRYRPRRGDRCDGRLVRSLDPMNGFALYIMPNRNGAATYYRDSFDCAAVEDYIKRKRDEGLDSFGIMHVIAAAYVRVISQRPAANRFISGQKIYTRDDGTAELEMVVKKELVADSPETIINVDFDLTDTAYDVYEKFNEQVKLAKQAPLDSSFDNLAWLLNSVPGVLKKFMVWLLKLLDYFGKLPKFLLKLSPFHGSIFITALGSLGIPPVFHHLYDFGNIPIFVAFGARHTETEIGPDGQPVRKKYMDYTIVSDERICDGYYYASSIKMFRRFLNNPEKLDVPPEEVLRDVY